MAQSSTTFSPETARMCSSPLRRMSSVICCGMFSSSPSTMPWTTSRTGGRRARGEDDAREASRRRSIRPADAAAAPSHAQRAEVRAQRHVFAAPLEVAAIVELPPLRRLQRLDGDRGER